MGGKEKEKGRKEGEWTGEEGGKKSFAPSPSLEAFNEDRLTRSLTKELVAERGKVIVIIIIIIAACVQSLWVCASFFFFLILLRNCSQFLMPFVLLPGSLRELRKILTEIIDEDHSKSRLIYFII